MPANPAATRPAVRNPIALTLTLTRRAAGAPANDDVCQDDEEQILHAALRHFAVHGLGAARAAYSEAQSASAAGDRHNAAAWADICRALDSRLAAGLPPRIA